MPVHPFCVFMTGVPLFKEKKLRCRQQDRQRNAQKQSFCYSRYTADGSRDLFNFILGDCPSPPQPVVWGSWPIPYVSSNQAAIP